MTYETGSKVDQLFASLRHTQRFHHTTIFLHSTTFFSYTFPTQSLFQITMQQLLHARVSCLSFIFMGRYSRVLSVTNRNYKLYTKLCTGNQSVAHAQEISRYCFKANYGYLRAR